MSASEIQWPVCSSQTAFGYWIGLHACSSISAIARCTDGYWLMVTDTSTPACRHADTNAPT
jgi:hypothetical protein